VEVLIRLCSRWEFFEIYYVKTVQMANFLQKKWALENNFVKMCLLNDAGKENIPESPLT
jgi:hypothetical protein